MLDNQKMSLYIAKHPLRGGVVGSHPPKWGITGLEDIMTVGTKEKRLDARTLGKCFFFFYF